MTERYFTKVNDDPVQKYDFWRGFSFLMFVYFKEPIRNITPSGIKSIEQLVNKIKCCNPNIADLRSLDHLEPEYKNKKDTLKRKTLDYITPNVSLFNGTRNDENITQFSDYLYFDKDFKPTEEVDFEKYRDNFIEKYKHAITMCCLSSSGRGISIFVKLQEGTINEHNFYQVREHVLNNVFKGETFDDNTGDKSRVWFISSDSNCYYNPDIIIDIPKSIFLVITNTTKRITRKNLFAKPEKRKHTYELHSYSKVLEKVKLRTPYVVKNRIYDYQPMEYCEVIIPYYKQCPGKIPDGQKLRVYGRMIHNLAYLNPGISPDYIYSYLFFVNKNYTVTPSLTQDLIKLVYSMYENDIMKTGKVEPKLRIKKRHYKENTISGVAKRRLKYEHIGLDKRIKSIRIIKEVRNYLEELMEESKSVFLVITNTTTRITRKNLYKVTQQVVCDYINKKAKEKEIPGISISTVKRYWNIEPIELEDVVEMENERIEITYVEAEIKHCDVLDTQILYRTGKAIQYKPEAELSPDEQRYIDELDELARKSKEIEEEQERCRQYNLNTSNRDKRWW